VNHRGYHELPHERSAAHAENCSVERVAGAVTFSMLLAQGNERDDIAGIGEEKENIDRGRER
jgi:hypothetical protein